MARLLPRFGRDLALYLPSKLVPALAGLVSIPIFTRLLSRAEYGLVSLIEASVALGIVLLAWTRVSMIRFYPAGEPVEAATLVRTALRTQLLSMLVLALAVAAWDVLFNSGPSLLTLCAIALFLVRALFRFLTQLLRARLDPTGFSSFQSWFAIAGLVGGACLAGLVLDLGPAGVVLGTALGGLSALPFLSRRALAGIELRGPVSRAAVGKMAAYGIPLAIGLLGAWALRRLDRYQIEIFYGADEVGLYTASYAVAQHSVLLLAGAFRLSSHPLLATTWETEGLEASRRFLSQVTRVYLVAVIPIVVGLSILARPVIELLVQRDFVSGYVIVPWVAAGAFFLGLQEFFSQTLTLVHRTRLVMAAMLAAAALNGLLNWWALPRYGYPAAAVTTLAAYAMLCLLVAIAARRLCHWRFPFAPLARVLVAVAAMALAVGWLVGQLSGSTPALQIAVSVPAGAAVYIAALLALRETTIEEVRALLRLRRRA